MKRCWNREGVEGENPPLRKVRPEPTGKRAGGGLLQTVNDARLIEVVGRHFHFDPITDRQADEPFAHATRDVGQDLVFVIELDAEHGSGEHGEDPAFEFNRLFHNFFGQKKVRDLFRQHPAP